MDWFFYALLSAIFAALVAFFGKLGLQGIDSTTATAARAVIMAIFTVGFAFALNKTSLQGIDAKNWLFIILTGVFGALSWLAYFYALKVGDVSKVAPIDRTSVLFAVALAFVFLGEEISVKTIAGAIAIVIGIILIAL
ncbi:MAG: EamA family transporter [Candidatus Diapherotrites archaeon]|nr:EamA family transporter [Candidatus Diapherotrites archaeon]